MVKDLGDFQTPLHLARTVVECLGPIGKVWPRVLEPTCGRGSFIEALISSEVPPAEIQGIEIQDSHWEVARQIAERPSQTHVILRKANLFDLDLRQDLKWNTFGPLLVIGNPPWITNSELGAIGSQNVPRKSNLKGLRGIDALTGSSNFDIAEFIWLKLIRELGKEQPTIALLCKTSVARSVLKFAHSARLPVVKASIRRLDAKKWFGAAVDACLFCVSLGSGKHRYEAEVYPNLHASIPESVFGIVHNQPIADMDAYKESAFADGICPMTWRQGIKHDAASVMELTRRSGSYRNRIGEIVNVEEQYIYPLVKSSDLFHDSCKTPRLSVIVTQRILGMDTRQLQWVAPRLWDYLCSHAKMFEKRRSSIYRNQPAFALFGIGDYSFSQYKVAIAGLYKTARFRAIGPVAGKPVLLDDTCYLMACASPEQAALLVSLLNNPLCLNFLSSMVFWDSKRPVTKNLLQRINLRAILARVNKDTLLSSMNTELERLGASPIQEKGGSNPSWEEILFQHAPKEEGFVEFLFK